MVGRCESNKSFGKVFLGKKADGDEMFDSPVNGPDTSKLI